MSGDDAVSIVHAGDDSVSVGVAEDGSLVALSENGASAVLALIDHDALLVDRDGGLVTVERAALAELVSATPAGVEQLFIVDEPRAQPSDAQQLRVSVAGLAPIVVADDLVHLVDEDGAARLEYGRLAVFDADARALPAWFSVDGTDIVISFIDDDATYPVVVDPLLTAAYYTKTFPTRQLTAGGTTGSGASGWAVASADLDGDGYDDLVVSSPTACQPAECQTQEGIVEIYRSSSTGPSTTPFRVLEGNSTNAQLGRSLAVVDVTNDGCDDIIAGAPAAGSGQGRVYVFKGDCNLLQWTQTGIVNSGVAGAGLGKRLVVADTYSDGIPAIYAIGNTAQVWQIRVNGDGTINSAGTISLAGVPGDVAQLAYATGYDRVAFSFPGLGIINIKRGSGLGLWDVGQVNVSCPPVGGEVPVQRCGTALGGADVNGDGRGDLLANDRGIDSTTGVARGWTHAWLATSTNTYVSAPSWTHQLPASSLGFSDTNAVAGLGDVNQDSFEDFALCDGNQDSGRGRCRVFSGSASGPELQRLDVVGTTTSDRLGDHQGVLAGARANTDYFENRANDFVVTSSTAPTRTMVVRAGLPAGYPLGGPGASQVISGALDFGAVVALLDLNSDGRDDLVVGTPSATVGGNLLAGRVDVFHAQTNNTFLSTPTWTVTGATAGAELGSSLAMIDDPNFGRSLAVGVPGACTVVSGITCQCSACGQVNIYGWVNGNQTPNTVVDRVATNTTVPGLRLGTTIANVGNAFGALPALAVSTRFASGPVMLFQPSATTEYTNVAGISGLCSVGTPEQLPFTLAGGSDIDGDGLHDLLVGVPACGLNGEGAALVFRSNGSGFGTVPYFSVTGGPGKAQLGAAVAYVGDVNKDGRTDFAVGAPLSSSGVGLVRVYRGTSTTPVLYQELPGGVASGKAGSAVAGGRDINRDGFADLIVGAPEGANLVGAAVVYMGTANGLKVHSGEPGVVPNGKLGTAVAMGSVSPDEFADIVVTTPRQTGTTGRAVVVRGQW